MDFQVQVLRRKVKRVRLEYSLEGLRVIVPTNYIGNIEDILVKHKAWINKRALKMESYQSQVDSLMLFNRTEAELQKEIISLLEEIVKDGSRVRPTQVKYRLMRARWGSCSKDRILTFNKTLKFLPRSLIRYVVAHELTHLIHMNHSMKFWQALSELEPDFKQLRQTLKLYGFALQKK